eukprot:CAMPEP_0195633682 /NCGR_PEP_ID=MMETSP0815-20121206/22280_1 /TAXON_ID=97485 /ORGANISM="Prymnesium parvum, Strain Texoma1" /LENGTH=176 /DNA_ID=CAMNT_0040775369 /DNA_START=480 /DNA_END=1007 /DNA_ORIENTATION=+
MPGKPTSTWTQRCCKARSTQQMRGELATRRAVKHVRDDIDDRTAALPHPCIESLATAQESAGEIRVNHCAPSLGGDLVSRRRELPPRVVHEEVKASEFVHRVPHETAHLFLLTNIANEMANARCGRSHLLEFSDRLEQPLLLARGDHYAAAQTDEVVAMALPIPDPPPVTTAHRLA